MFSEREDRETGGTIFHTCRKGNKGYIIDFIVIEGLAVDVLIGTAVMGQLQMTINCKEEYVDIGKDQYRFSWRNSRQAEVLTIKETIIKPGEITKVPISLPFKGQLLVEAIDMGQGIQAYDGVMFDDQKFMYIGNHTSEDFTLDKNTVVGQAFKHRADYQISSDGIFLMENFPPDSAKEEEVQEVKVNPKLTEKTRKRLQGLLQKFKKLFSAETVNGNPKLEVRHRIRLKDRNIQFKRVSYGRRSPEEKEDDIAWVKELLRRGLVEEGKGEFVAPLLRVNKKGTTKKRLVLDYRQLNANTVPDMYPLPRIDDMLDCLKGAVLFTIIDATDGFGFVVGDKHYQWRVMPMGLANSPSTFQRMMNKVLEGLIGECCLVYIDDIIVFGKTVEEHNQNLLNARWDLRRSNSWDT
eukprot:TRINITY_DN1776_c0_g1_i3.p3 TRINITY_DN1776_c0_g1~~TRINITY_DN1776_c0_g1_i3.p3  ORF type:complete len:409 (+),score=46.86 TRINITY_DN1776_c0_g1_i3:1856-3082(+)